MLVITIKEASDINMDSLAGRIRAEVRRRPIREGRCRIERLTREGVAGDIVHAPEMSISGPHYFLSYIGSLPIQDAPISTRSENELWDRGPDICTLGDSGRVTLPCDIVDPCLPSG